MLVRCDLEGGDFSYQMRRQRAKLLASSDWTQFNDSPLTAEQKGAWATYRQQLRDFPATWVPSETAEFPDPPEAN